MKLRLFDESVSFSCATCTACCNQPWRTLIEPEKARALDAHDFGSKYPQLNGKTFYYSNGSDTGGRYELAKGEGMRCLFLDVDGLCIIHKELGAQAKPDMCRQFPFLPAHTWTQERISANYGCPSVQKATGRPLSDQAGDIADVITPGARPPDPTAPTPLDATTSLTPEEADALFDRAIAIFDSRREGDIWTRFAELLATLVAVREWKTAKPAPGGADAGLVEALRAPGSFPGAPPVPAITGFESPAKTPAPARFLFAATLYPDTLPFDAAPAAGFFGRLTLIPRLMALAKLSGGYASRLLGRNVVVHEVLRHALEPELEPAATHLLVRYYASRLWQRFPAGTRLTIIAGIHQHIQDLNAILFFARAEACHTGQDRLTEPLIRQALTRVEFHLANQNRLHDHVLKNWLRGWLANPSLAFQSLRLMALRGAAQTV